MSQQHHKATDYIKAAEKNGLRVEAGKGSHIKVYGPAGRGYMTIPNHNCDLANGTERAIAKWFKMLGILLSLVLVLSIASPQFGFALWTLFFGG